MTYLGDYPASHTAVCIPFDSFAAATGASSATSNFASSDVLIYKDAGTTQRASASGITVSTSFDSQTGLNMIVIDLSDNTDAGFYSAGHEYQVAVADITIDSQTVRFWAGAFSIERAGGVLALLKGNAVKVDVNTIKTQAVTAALGVTFPSSIASPTNITAATGVTVSTNNDKTGYSLTSGPLDAAGVRSAVGLGSANLDTQLSGLDGKIGTPAVTLADDIAGISVGSAPTAAENADAVWDELLSGHVISGSAGEALSGAGSAGDPWIATIEGSLNARDVMRILAAVAAGKTTIVKTGSGSATVTFRDVTDSSDIVEASMVQSERAAVTVTP